GTCCSSRNTLPQASCYSTCGCPRATASGTNRKETSHPGGTPEHCGLGPDTPSTHQLDSTRYPAIPLFHRAGWLLATGGPSQCLHVPARSRTQLESKVA